MMNIAPVKESQESREHVSLGRDLAVVALVTFGVAAFAVYAELNEAMFTVTRRWEVFQLDEVPVTLLALTLGLTWFAWRRFRDARIQLGRRQAAEALLATLLLENRRLAQQYLQLQESERKFLAHELHDELGQYLNAIKIDAVAIQQRAGDDASPLLRASAIIGHTDHVHGVVRDLVHRLRPIGLDELGLRAALEHFLDDWRRRLPQLRIDVELQGDLDGVGELLALALYRLLQEGLTNVSKHARANHVEVRLLRTAGAATAADEVVFTLADDGGGADLGQKSVGLGLIGMRERVEMLGGEFQVTTGPARGFRLFARIPVVHCDQSQTP